MILATNSCYLVGIKGVAMTALAQCLVDAGKKVQGSDVAEDFVTAHQLRRIQIVPDVGFEPEYIQTAECVIYTAAHQGQHNPQVIAAQQRGIPTYSHAEALGQLFNQQQGIAVCGVGGKSTTSAMIAWILADQARQGVIGEPSFAVGVGNIPGLEKTGQWRADGTYFVAEADEYVVDPSAVSRGEDIIPRFSYLKPSITVCTNLAFDHPDVYRDFNHTQAVFVDFFKQGKPNQTLIVNQDDQTLMDLVNQHLPRARVLTFGHHQAADMRLISIDNAPHKTVAHIDFDNQTFSLTLKIPGGFNLMNALAALLVSHHIGIKLSAAIESLTQFRSTQRRSEFVGSKAGVLYYDDYAHHPQEVARIIEAFRDWYPHHRLVVGFQSHTFSRTKALFNQFVEAFHQADEVLMTDIFPSAREPYDSTISSDLLCQAIQAAHPQVLAHNLHTNQALAEYCMNQLRPGDIFLTVGAGDIYHLHDLIPANTSDHYP